MTRNLKVTYEETGEVRPPLEGEWFRGTGGYEVRARFDFSAQSFPILREVIVEIEAEVDVQAAADGGAL